MRAYPYLPILTALLLAAAPLTAQQVPFLNHYTWNPRLFNPAGQGAENNGEISAVYRSQFSQIDAAARPNTYLVHADLSPLFNERIGVAAQLMGDKAHLLSRFQFNGFFAYHLVRTPSLRFSLGAAAGINSFNFNFDGARVGDVLDLAIFYGQLNTLRFDGGPGLALEYRTAGGSLFALDAAATQLFSSDIRIDGDPNIAQQGALYDLVPHVLVNARYRYQGNGFAVEPNVAFRALAGGRPLDAGVFDLNLNAYFLQNNRIMAGIGMRTDNGGLHFQIGVTPAAAIRLIASAELHTALGTTYEVGASYTFGKQAPPPPVSTPSQPLPAENTGENLVQNAYRDVLSIADAMEPQITAVRARQEQAGGAIAGGISEQNRKNKAAAADSCAAHLARTDLDLQRLQQMANAIDVKRLQAEQAVRNASSQGAALSPATLATLQAIKERNADINGQLETLSGAQQFLREQCAGLKPDYSEAACLRAGDTDCLQDLFSNRLGAVAGLPATLYPLRIFAVPGAAAISYQYPDDAEAYLPTPDIRALAGHVADQMRQLKQQGIQLDNIGLVTLLQEDRNTLGYRPGLSYDGALGATSVAYNLIDNNTGAASPQTLQPAAGIPLNLESIGALKLAALRQYLIQSGVPANQITLEVRYNHDDIIYREETKMVLRVRG